MKYSTQLTKKHSSAMGVSLPISLKQSVEVCREIRGKQLGRVMNILDSVIAGKESIAFKRYNRGGVGHRVGKGPGRMPIKTCTEIRMLLRSAKSNAETKGLNVNNLFVHSALAKKAPTTRHYGGRRGRRLSKRAHVEVVLEEKEIQTRQPTRPTQAKQEQKTPVAEKVAESKPTTVSPTTIEKQTPKQEVPKQEVKKEATASPIEKEKQTTQETPKQEVKKEENKEATASPTPTKEQTPSQDDNKEEKQNTAPKTEEKQ